MAVKIRLQRHGKKNFAFFHIVVADARAPRDGRYIEQLSHRSRQTRNSLIGKLREMLRSRLRNLVLTRLPLRKPKQLLQLKKK